MAAAPDLHWRDTRRLTLVLLSVWFLSTFATIYFARELDELFTGWPLGFWLASQGMLLVFLVIVVVYAVGMNRLERKRQEAP